VTLERITALLTGAAIALMLSALVIAAFASPNTVRLSGADALAAVTAERAVPIARGMDRVRDDPPADLVARVDATEGIATAEASDDWLTRPLPMVTPEPTPEPTPVPTPAPTPRPTPAPARSAAPAPVLTADTAAAEQRTLVLMNASRAEGGLVPLALDASVSAAARLHSAVESRYGYVYHDGPDGTAKSRDAAACGTGWYGENTGKVWQGNVDRLHVEFMSEPWDPINHRTNIMDPAFRRVGIGAVQGSDALYMTMVFCR
jgi:uncharacterized protein YkwD